jgi:hypothetical protein
VKPLTITRAFVAVAVFASVVASPAWADVARPYDHHWAAEEMYAGDAGATSVTTLQDSVTMRLDQGEWKGTINYADVMGIKDMSGAVASQVSHITLALEGSALEGGASIGGRFDGTATLKVSSAPSLQAASSASKVDAPGDTAVYDVSGFWAAQLDGDKASGHLFFQSARPQDGSEGELREADWFNRVSSTTPGSMGEPQPFTVVVEGLSSATGTSKPVAQTKPRQTRPSKPPVQPSAMSYILRGLRGAALSTPVPVTTEMAYAARALRDASPAGATKLPAGSVAIDIDVAGATLDAKNRAVGLLGVDAPKGPEAAAAGKSFSALVASFPSHAAPAEDQDAGLALAKRLEAALNAHPGIPGAAAIGADAAAIPAGADPGVVRQLRAWVAVAEALATQPGVSTLATVRAVSSRIAEKPVPTSGPLADAVLAAADSPRAPASAVRVAQFARDAALDTSSTAEGRSPVQRAFAVLKAQGQVTPAIVWTQAGAENGVSPVSWLAYRRADGTLFWLAGPDGPVAIRESGVHGWAWNGQRAVVVDAGRAGRFLSAIELVTP